MYKPVFLLLATELTVPLSQKMYSVSKWNHKSKIWSPLSRRSSKRQKVIETGMVTQNCCYIKIISTAFLGGHVIYGKRLPSKIWCYKETGLGTSTHTPTHPPTHTNGELTVHYQPNLHKVPLLSLPTGRIHQFIGCITVVHSLIILCYVSEVTVIPLFIVHLREMWEVR